MSDYYVLDGHRPVDVPFEDTRPLWDDPQKRTVARTEVPEGVEVSTVFLVIDHNMSGTGPPVLFETMVFCQEALPEMNEECERYCTWEEAEAGHAAMVERVTAALAAKAATP